METRNGEKYQICRMARDMQNLLFLKDVTIVKKGVQRTETKSKQAKEKYIVTNKLCLF